MMALDLRGLHPGTVVHNRYRIVQVLGAGGFGITYKVVDQKTNQTAAMKEYMPRDIAHRVVGTGEVRPLTEANRALYEKFHQQFYKEAQAIYSLRGHPNIVEIKDLFYDNNTVYYVMEYVEGMDLKQVLNRQGGRLAWAQLKPLMEQVVAGLTQVHASGLIHCDISPDNIFLIKGGRIKLLDFGAARNVLRGSVEMSVIVAKPGFAPCEQMRGKNLNTWTDVYALAVTIYCCITGKMVQDSMERILHVQTIWPSQMGIAIPSPAWEQALKKGMALRMEDRYHTVGEFWKALTESGPRSAQQDYRSPMPHPAAQPSFPRLQGIQGVFANRVITVNREYYMGVDPSRCQIAFPVGTPGVSRLHARIWADQGGIVVIDMGSTYGTTINGRKLTQGCAYRLNVGNTLCLGGGQTFRMV